MTREEWEALPQGERAEHNARCMRLKTWPDGSPWRASGPWPAPIIPWSPEDWADE